jgi:hypothetical protein
VATPISNNEVVYGWKLEVDEYNNQTLVLDDFHFTTSCEIALRIIGSGAKVQINDNCSITTIGNQGDTQYKGIKSDCDIEFTGTGKLTLTSNGATSYTALQVEHDLTILGGKYIFEGIDYGVKLQDTTSKKLTINNSNILATASSNNESAGAIYVPDGVRVDVYEHVKVAKKVDGTNDDDEVAEIITNYNTSYITCNTKKYIKMEAAIVSVTITWGDMTFNGENIWQPDSHEYICNVTPNNNDSGLVIVQNDAKSNIPVKTRVELDIIDNSYTLTWSNNTWPLNTDKRLGINSSLQGSLSLSRIQPYDDVTLIDDGYGSSNTTTVGTVTVKLGDYRTVQE